jgi:hypothetical protein
MTRTENAFWILKKHDVKPVRDRVPQSEPLAAKTGLPFAKIPALDQFAAWYSKFNGASDADRVAECYGFLVLSHGGPGQGEMATIGIDEAAPFLALGARLANRAGVTVLLSPAELRRNSLASASNRRSLAFLQKRVKELGAEGLLSSTGNVSTWNKSLRLLHVAETSDFAEKTFVDLLPRLADEGLVAYRIGENQPTWVAELCGKEKGYKQLAQIEQVRVLQKLPSASSTGQIAPNKQRLLEEQTIEQFQSRCRIFVLHHGTGPRVERPYLHKINLDDLPIPAEFQDNRLAESRIYLWDEIANCEQEYLGFATASWDEKWFRLLPLDRLHWIDSMLTPDQVLAALPTATSSWMRDSETCHPGMAALIEEMSTVSAVPLSEQPTFWANNFVCHRDVFQSFLTSWKKMFFHFYRKYGFDPPFSVGTFDCKRKFAYLAERFTMLYFSSRSDLKILRIPFR